MGESLNNQEFIVIIMSSESKSTSSKADLVYLCDVATDGTKKYDEKFIFVKHIQKQEGKNTVKQYKILSKPLAYHADIWDACEDERSEGYKVYGGGLVKIDPENKTVETYGQSGAFGKVSKEDFETVAKCLKKQFPDYEIEVKVSNFIKG